MLKTKAQKLEKTSPAQAKEFAEAARLVNRNINLARDLARGLHPVDLDSGSLGHALKELAFRANQETVACRCDCPQTVRVPDQAVALNLYRIAAEAVQNALKHAKARNITISLKRGRSGLVLEVRDDGKGMQQKNTGKGMGLDIMRHRANVIGARFQIESVAGRGTTVTCTLPGE
jgi:signal transduction histidine kinase